MIPWKITFKRVLYFCPKPLTEYLKKLYGAKIAKVTVSPRVETTPCILVTSQYGNRFCFGMQFIFSAKLHGQNHFHNNFMHSANMERIMRSQAFSDPSKASYMNSPRTMEVNPRHPIIAELNRQAKADPDGQSTADTAWLLYDTALLQSGFAQDDIDSFASRMFQTMKGAKAGIAHLT